MANERTHVPTTTRKRKREVLTEQSGVDEEDGREIQSETPGQGDMPRDRGTFRRINHSSRDTKCFCQTPNAGRCVGLSPQLSVLACTGEQYLNT